MLYVLSCWAMALAFVVTILTPNRDYRLLGLSVFVADMLSTLIELPPSGGFYAIFELGVLAVLCRSICGKMEQWKLAVLIISAAILACYVVKWVPLGMPGRLPYAQAVNLLDTIRSGLLIAFIAPTAGARIIGYTRKWDMLPNNMGDYDDLEKGLKYARVESRPRLGLPAEAPTRDSRTG